MKKKMMIMIMILMVLCNTMTALASPQRPFEWQGGVGSYNFDYDTLTVEMKNGDGTDVQTVNGRYIANNSIKDWNGVSAYPMSGNSSDIKVLPKNVDSVPCQIVKEDAYLIMPFDGFVSINITDEVGAGNNFNICVRANAGDKVNMIPKNLVYTYIDPNSSNETNDEWYRQLLELSEYEKKCYENTTADDWTYSLRIYKEVPVPHYQKGATRKENKENLISQIFSNDREFGVLWFLYQVDAPNTTLKAKSISLEEYKLSYNYVDSNSNYHILLKDDKGELVNGWVESPEFEGKWSYFLEGRKVRLSDYNFVPVGLPNKERKNPDVYELKYPEAPFTVDESSTVRIDEKYKGIITIKDKEPYVDGYKVNIANFSWTEPEFNILNAQ